MRHPRAMTDGHEVAGRRGEWGEAAPIGSGDVRMSGSTARSAGGLRIRTTIRRLVRWRALDSRLGAVAE